MKQIVINEDGIVVNGMTLGEVVSLLHAGIATLQDQLNEDGIVVDILDMLGEMRQMETLEAAGYSEAEALKIIHEEDAV